jgi:hypothetical protein
VLVPAPRPQNDPHDGEHDRHFDQHADDGRQRGARLKAKQRDRCGDRELEEIGGADSSSPLFRRSLTRRMAVGRSCPTALLTRYSGYAFRGKLDEFVNRVSDLADYQLRSRRIMEKWGRYLAPGISHVLTMCSCCCDWIGSAQVVMS